MNKWIQYRGIVTQEDCYVVKANGKQFYFLNKNEINRIKEKENEKRIKELSDIVGRLFIDIYKGKKYKNAVSLYKECGIERAKDNEYL